MLMQEGIPLRKIESIKNSKPLDGEPSGVHDLTYPQPGDF